MSTRPNPLFGAAPKSVPLPRSPLVSVLIQARFEQILALSKPEVAAGFQELIRSRYPVLTQEATLQIGIKNGQPEIRPQNNWRFADETGKWVVSLHTSFVTLHTRAYKSRGDMLERFAEVVNALANSVRPSTLNRLGVRYVDQIHGAEFQQLDKLVEADMRGIERPALRAHIVQSMHDTTCSIEEGRLRARWGIMPPSTSHDASVLPPIDTNSWVLDVDSYAEYEVPLRFDPKSAVEKAAALVDRSYAVFRSVVTEQFIKMYGGEI